MLLERQLAADPRLADLPIRLPPPVVNPDWPQAGGVPSHAMHHLAANDDLKLAWRVDIGSGTAGASRTPGAAGGRPGPRLHDGRRGRDQRVRRPQWPAPLAVPARGRRCRQRPARRRPRLRQRLAVRDHELGQGPGAERDQGHRDLAPGPGPAAARRADRRPGPPAGALGRQPALRPRRRDRPPGLAPCRLLRGCGPARRPEPGGRRRGRGRALFLGRGVRAPARQRPPAVERHRPAAAPDRGARPDQRHRRPAGDRGRSGLRRGLRRADGGDPAAAGRAHLGPRSRQHPGAVAGRRLHLRADDPQRDRLPAARQRRHPLGEPAAPADRSERPGARRRSTGPGRSWSATGC